MRPKEKRTTLIQAFYEAQSLEKNHVSGQKLKEIAKEAGVSLSEASGVLSFYSLFSQKPRGKFVLRLCDSLPCRLSGSEDLYETLKKYLGIENGETTPDGLFTLERVNCLGACGKAPNLMLNEKLYSELSLKTLVEILSECRREEKP